MILSMINMRLILLLACLLTSGSLLAQRPSRPPSINTCTLGDAQKWMQFIEHNFDYNAVRTALPDSLKGFSDTLTVQFLVTKTGEVKVAGTGRTDTHVFKEEILKVIAAYPEWKKPGVSRAEECKKAFIFIYYLLADTQSLKIIDRRFWGEEF
jgi:hypothetical protein